MLGWHAASLRMGTVPDMDPSWAVKGGGRGLAEPAMLEYQLNVLTELIVDWGVDGEKCGRLSLDLVVICPYENGPQ